MLAAVAVASSPGHSWRLFSLLSAPPESGLQPVCPTPEDSAFINANLADVLFSTDLILIPGSNLYNAGRIGALHALADIYASGGTPRWAVVTLVLNRHQPFKNAQAIMQGVRDACAAEEVEIVGGHTINSQESMVGLSVIGNSNGLPLRKANALPGDLLFLTKPIGTGLSLLGFKEGFCDEASLSEAIDTMLISSKSAASAARQLGATAVTDVSGFGLIGHLSEMLRTGIGAELVARDIPILPFAQNPPLSLAQTTALKNNHEYARSHVGVELSAPLHELAALFDAETNGPLLIAAAESARAPFVANGFLEIGRFTCDGRIVVK
jgi:selenide,water dikinase